MIDFIIELVMEIVGDGLSEVANSRRLPLWARIGAISILCLPLAVLLIYAAVESFLAENTVGTVIPAIIAAFFLIGWLVLLIRILKNK